MTQTHNGDQGNVKFLEVVNKLIVVKFSKDFSICRRKTNRIVVFNIGFSPTFLNTGVTDETFQQSGKQDSFRRILKSSANVYEIPILQLFRNNTVIKSRLDTFDDSGLVITFLTNFADARILYSLRLVLEAKAVKEIPGSSRLEFCEQFSANNFAFSDAEVNT